MWEDELQRSFAMEMVQDVERSLSVERARSEEMQQNLLRDEMEQYRLDLERKVRVKQRQLDELEMRVEGEDEAARAIRKMHGALTDELEEAMVELRRVQQGKRRRESIASTIEGDEARALVEEWLVGEAVDSRLRAWLAARTDALGVVVDEDVMRRVTCCREGEPYLAPAEES